MASVVQLFNNHLGELVMEQYLPYLIIAAAIGAIVFFVRKKKNKSVSRTGFGGHADKTRNTGKQHQK